MKTLMSVRGAPVQLVDDGSVSFIGGMTINADGSPRAYGPNGLGLDYLDNAGHPGNWWALVVNPVTKKPFIQGVDAPAFSKETEGYYVSTTSYFRKGIPLYSPRAYLNSETEKYIVLPGPLFRMVKPVVLGCRALVIDRTTGQQEWAVVGDKGPATHLGEGSIALAEAFHVNSDPKHGGTDEPRFIYKAYPGIFAPGYDLIPQMKLAA